MSLLLLSQCKQHFKMFKNIMKEVKRFYMLYWQGDTCNKMWHAFWISQRSDHEEIHGLHDPPPTYLVQTLTPHASFLFLNVWAPSSFPVKLSVFPVLTHFLYFHLGALLQSLRYLHDHPKVFLLIGIAISKFICFFTATMMVYTEWIKFGDVQCDNFHCF